MLDDQALEWNPSPHIGPSCVAPSDPARHGVQPQSEVGSSVLAPVGDQCELPSLGSAEGRASVEWWDVNPVTESSCRCPFFWFVWFLFLFFFPFCFIF